MTNADYYVNVYRDGSTGACYRSLNQASGCAVAPIIGVWHVRLKKGKE